MNTAHLGDALAYAAAAHAGQVRKGGNIPYIYHPMAVSALVLEYGGDVEQAIAGLLHDVLEDCSVEHAPEIGRLFGPRVLSLVEGCTDGTPGATGRKAPWRERKEAYLRCLTDAPDDVLLVSISDKLHNARAIVADLRAVGPVVFDRFTAGAEGTVWYYRHLAVIFADRLGNHPAVAALAREVDALAG
jgi:(p)ppGpp synthase/HD superfamily hydrolase